MLRRADHLGVTVLADHHDEACRQLAGPVEHRFDGLSVTVTADGALTLDDGLARFDCTIHDEVTAGDHVIVHPPAARRGPRRRLRAAGLPPQRLRLDQPHRLTHPPAHQFPERPPDVPDHRALRTDDAADPASRRARVRRRRHHRVVRLLPLRHRRRARLRAPVLQRPQRRRRPVRLVRHLRRRVPGPARRRLHLRPLRRPRRAQEDAAAHAGDHGRRHRGDRPAPVVRRDRLVGTRPAGDAARAAGHRRRRRVRRRGAARGGVRPGRAARVPRQLRAHRRAGRPAAGQRRVLAGQPAARRGVPRLGLAGLLPGQRGAAGDRRLHPALGHGDPGVRARAGEQGGLAAAAARPGRRPAQAAAARHGHPVHRGLHVQLLLGLPAGLRRDHPGDLAVAGARRRDGRRGAGRRARADLRPALGQGRSQAGVPGRGVARAGHRVPGRRAGAVRRRHRRLRGVRDRPGTAVRRRSTARWRRSGPSCSTPATATRRSARSTRCPGSWPRGSRRSSRPGWSPAATAASGWSPATTCSWRPSASPARTTCRRPGAGTSTSPIAQEPSRRVLEPVSAG